MYCFFINEWLDDLGEFAVFIIRRDPLSSNIGLLVPYQNQQLRTMEVVGA